MPPCAIFTTKRVHDVRVEFVEVKNPDGDFREFMASISTMYIQPEAFVVVFDLRQLAGRPSWANISELVQYLNNQENFIRKFCQYVVVVVPSGLLRNFLYTTYRTLQIIRPSACPVLFVNREQDLCPPSGCIPIF